MTASLLSQLAMSTGSRTPVTDLSTEANGRNGAGNWAEQEQGLWGDLLDSLVEMLGVSFEASERDNIAFESSCQTLTSLQTLATEFFSGHRAISEQDAKVYQISVESVMIAGGFTVTPDLMTPSFESKDNYSAEAQEKSSGVLKRVWEWMVEQFKKIIAGISELIGKFKTSSLAGKARVEKLRVRLEKLVSRKTDDVSTEAASAGVAVPDLNLLGGGGSQTISVLSKAKSNTQAAGTETLTILRKSMDVFKGFRPGEHDTTEGSDKMLQQLVSALSLKQEDGNYLRDLPIGPGNSVRIELTGGNSGRIGAKVSSHQEVKKPGMAPGMTAAECVQLLDALASSYGDFDAMKTPMDSAARVFKSMSAAMDKGFKESMTKLNESPDIEAKRMAAKASQIYAMFGTILSQLARLPRMNLSTYMLTQYAIEKYLDSCVDALEQKKAA